MRFDIQPILENEKTILYPLHENDFEVLVYFHIGANNIRSQVAIERIGADKITEQIVTYPDGTSRLNFLYKISKEKWLKFQ
ncbi:MAG: hypothetical protein QM763_01390 [Agriterribacter sp.]